MLYFRKSIKVGKNSKVNISKSGISISTKVGGMTINTKNGKSTLYMSIPGTGIQIKKKLP